MNRTIRFVSKADSETILNEMERCLGSKGVRMKREHEKIESYQIAMPLFLVGFDKRLYSRDNWIGINPFLHIDSFTLSTTRNGNLTEIEFNYSQLWPVFPTLFMIGVFAFAYPRAPVAITVLSVVFVIGFILFEFYVLGVIAIKDEINRALQQAASSGDTNSVARRALIVGQDGSEMR